MLACLCPRWSVTACPCNSIGLTPQAMAAQRIRSLGIVWSPLQSRRKLPRRCCSRSRKRNSETSCLLERTNQRLLRAKPIGVEDSRARDIRPSPKMSRKKIPPGLFQLQRPLAGCNGQWKKLQLKLCTAAATKSSFCLTRQHSSPAPDWQQAKEQPQNQSGICSEPSANHDRPLAPVVAASRASRALSMEPGVCDIFPHKIS